MTRYVNLNNKLFLGGIMSIALNPGFSGSISVMGKSNELYRQEIHSFKEATDFVNKYGKSVPGESLWKATIIPLRTDNWKDFAIDLFLPTFINHAIKVDNIALKIIASLFAIALDIITFIPRLVASPFRAIYNNKHKSEHPLEGLLKDKPKFTQAAKSGVLKIQVKFENVAIQEDEDLNTKTAKKFAVDGFLMVTIKRLPELKANQPEFNEESVDYMLVEGEWDAQSRETGKSRVLRSAC